MALGGFEITAPELPKSLVECVGSRLRRPDVGREVLDPVSIAAARAQLGECVRDAKQTLNLDFFGPCARHGCQSTTTKPGAHSRLGYLMSPSRLRDGGPACVGNRFEPRRRILERG